MPTLHSTEWLKVALGARGLQLQEWVMGPVMCHEMGARTGRPAHPVEVKASFRRSTWLLLLLLAHTAPARLQPALNPCRFCSPWQFIINCQSRAVSFFFPFASSTCLFLPSTSDRDSFLGKK